MLLEKVSKTCKKMGEIKDFDSLAPWSLKSQVNYFLPAVIGAFNSVQRLQAARCDRFLDRFPEHP